MIVCPLELQQQNGQAGPLPQEVVEEALSGPNHLFELKVYRNLAEKQKAEIIKMQQDARRQQEK